MLFKMIGWLFIFSMNGIEMVKQKMFVFLFGYLYPDMWVPLFNFNDVNVKTNVYFPVGGLPFCSVSALKMFVCVCGCVLLCPR